MNNHLRKLPFCILETQTNFGKLSYNKSNLGHRLTDEISSIISLFFGCLFYDVKLAGKKPQWICRLQRLSKVSIWALIAITVASLNWIRSSPSSGFRLYICFGFLLPWWMESDIIILYKTSSCVWTCRLISQVFTVLSSDVALNFTQIDSFPFQDIISEKLRSRFPPKIKRRLDSALQFLTTAGKTTPKLLSNFSQPQKAQTNTTLSPPRTQYHLFLTLSDHFIIAFRC